MKVLLPMLIRFYKGVVKENYELMFDVSNGLAFVEAEMLGLCLRMWWEFGLSKEFGLSLIQN